VDNDELQRQLFLKQLQINRLLDITQAINNNVRAEGLYSMYKSFLNWELGVRKLALYVAKEDTWECVTHTGIEEELTTTDIKPLVPLFGNALKKLFDIKHPFTAEFEMVVPVFHKEEAIAFAFVGGYENTDFSKIQLITTITNIIAVAIENKRMFKQQLEKERFNHEIKLAAQMQRSLVPKTLPQNGCFEVDAYYQPHFGVGGDYYDFFKIKEDRYLLIVADIAGKGLPAALVMSNFQANLHAILKRTKSPEDFIAQLNTAVLRLSKSDFYLTLFVCDFDTQTRRLRYVNAGHIPPFLVMKNTVQQLHKGCTILGFFDKLPELEVGEVYIEQDAMLCVFTDGITDVRDPDGSYFNEEKLESFVLENAHTSAKLFNERLISKIEKFKGEEEYPDDMTVLTCRFFEQEDNA
jgi:phosphoserine phosphatase RsbU/P